MFSMDFHLKDGARFVSTFSLSPSLLCCKSRISKVHIRTHNLLQRKYGGAFSMPPHSIFEVQREASSYHELCFCLASIYFCCASLHLGKRSFSHFRLHFCTTQCKLFLFLWAVINTVHERHL